MHYEEQREKGQKIAFISKKLPKTKTLEELYGLEKKEVQLTRGVTASGRYLEKFRSPGPVLVEISFPEFTCLCPKTSQPDFATIKLIYVPDKWCVELKSLKYYLNSFRNEGHFHEQVTLLIHDELKAFMDPKRIWIQGKFNVRGGTYPIIEVGDA